MDEAAERRSRYGAIDWYAWRLANWGSKWSASNVEDRGTETLEGWTPYALYSRLEEKYGVSVYAVDYDEDLHGVFGYGDPETVSRLFDVGVTADEEGYPDPDVWFTTLEETDLGDLTSAHGGPCPQDLRGWEVRDDSVD